MASKFGLDREDARRHTHASEQLGCLPQLALPSRARREFGALEVDERLVRDLTCFRNHTLGLIQIRLAATDAGTRQKRPGLANSRPRSAPVKEFDVPLY